MQSSKRGTAALVAALLMGVAAPSAWAAEVQIALKNPSSTPAGLPADLTDVVGVVVCKSDIHPIVKDDLNFQTNIASLEVAPGEYCLAVISSMTLKVRGAGALVTYVASDRPLLVPISSSVTVQQNVAAEDSAVSFALTQPHSALPQQLWFASQISQGKRPVVGIDFTRDLVIKNVKNIP